MQGFVNTAPYPAFGGWTAGVSARSSPVQQLKAFQFFAYLTNPDNSWADVLSPTSTVDPFRDDHMNSK